MIANQAMRRIGDVLMGLGAAVGVAVALAFLLRLGVDAFPWLVVVGLYKVTFAASLGLIGAGAVARRLGIRAETRRALRNGDYP